MFEFMVMLFKQNDKITCALAQVGPYLNLRLGQTKILLVSWTSSGRPMMEMEFKVK